ncbi:MAG: RNA polymerase sigma factor [Candidatus Magasanikbacteria bacterium]|nr:RNA polymerase sigma factor [Candidatus Magasanikbacteria bacterium]
MEKREIKNKKNEEEFLAIYDKYADAIFRFCYWRLFERELAKDVMQEAFLKAWEYLSSGRQVENLRAFVFKIARNLIIDNRRVKKEMSSVEEMAEIGQEVMAKDEQWNLRLDLARVKCLLDELDEIYREAVALRYIEGLRPKEIAEILGESEDVVSVRIHRGLKKMKELIKKYEIF